MSNNKFKVLIIEDEANICSFIQTLLETNGYQALVAQTSSSWTSACPTGTVWTPSAPSGRSI